MTKTEFNTLVSWIIFIGLWIFTVAITISLFNLYSDKTVFDDNFNEAKACLCISLLGLAIFIFIVSKNKLVSIDYLNQQIIAKNLISRKTVCYHFSELDGYYDIAVNHSVKTKLYTKAIGIVKDKKIVVLIDSYYCSNLAEIRDGLDKLRHLGVDRNWEKEKFDLH